MLAVLRASKWIAKQSLQAVASVHFSVPTRGRRVVLLTFDDGPHPTVTRGVLERLARFQAKAIFFVVGNRIPLAADALREILDEGHQIGNHTFTHPLDRKLRGKDYIDDVARCQAVIESVTNGRSCFFRPALGLTVSALVAAYANQLKTVLWSLDSRDWELRSVADAQDRARVLGAEVRAGHIILFHDDNPCVLDILDVLLPELVDQGFNLGARLQ